MFPRLPRLLRLAIVGSSLVLLSLVLMLKNGLQDSVVVDLLRSVDTTPANLGFLQSTPHKQILLSSQFRHMTSTALLLQHPKLGLVSSQPDKKTLKTEAVVKNPHHFGYILNPHQACTTPQSRSVRLLIYVHAAPANLKKRQSIRQTWGDPQLLRVLNASLVFIMGSVVEPSLMDLVQMESELYGDIVQEDFLDTYRNLTYKAIAGLKWAGTYCPNVTYILKTDDDILVNLPQLINYINKEVEPKYGHRRLIVCNQWLRMKILRDKKSKWYIPEDDFPGEYFPPYCSGSAFLLSGDMALAMYKASLEIPFFWVDDYYITGALIKKLGIQHQRFNAAYLLNPSVAEDKFRNDTKHELVFFHLHKLSLMYRMWRNMTMDFKHLNPNATKISHTQKILTAA